MQIPGSNPREAHSGGSAQGLEICILTSIPNDSDTSRFHDIDVTIPDQKCRIGYVEDAENGLVTIKSPNSTAELTMNCKNLQVVVYSKNNNEIEPGNLNSITKGSEVIAYQTTWSYNFIIVIK